MGHPHHEPDPAQAVPAPKAQRNFTDADSRIMLDVATTGFVQAYNAQAAVDGGCQIIVAAEVSQQASDSGQLLPLLAQVQANTGALPDQASADAGNFSEANVTADALAGVALFIPPQKREGSTAQPGGRGWPQHAAVAAMRAKLATAAGKDVYRMRKAIVEPVFGQVKAVRGFRQFLFRGLAKVQAEWRLICLGHNLLKLFRSGVPRPG